MHKRERMCMAIPTSHVDVLGQHKMRILSTVGHQNDILERPACSIASRTLHPCVPGLSDVLLGSGA